MIVYVVLGYDSDTDTRGEVQGVFSTWDKAAECANSLIHEGVWEEAGIQEWGLDDPTGCVEAAGYHFGKKAADPCCRWCHMWRQQ